MIPYTDRYVVLNYKYLYKRISVFYYKSGTLIQTNAFNL